jgi:hypothetical protein
MRGIVQLSRPAMCKEDKRAKGAGSLTVLKDVFKCFFSGEAA